MMASNRRLRIAVMPGDGIGREVMDAALAVLDAAADSSSNVGFNRDGGEMTGGAGVAGGAEPAGDGAGIADTGTGPAGSGFTLAYEHLAAGAEAYRATGVAMSEEVFEQARSADAILFGAMGLPDVRYADGTEIAPQLDWLAERHDAPACAEAGRRIDAAVAAVLAEGRVRPADLGGADGTEAVTRAIVDALGERRPLARSLPGDSA